MCPRRTNGLGISVFAAGLGVTQWMLSRGLGSQPATRVYAMLAEGPPWKTNPWVPVSYLNLVGARVMAAPRMIPG